MDADDPLILPQWPPEPITLRDGEQVKITGNHGPMSERPVDLSAGDSWEKLARDAMAWIHSPDKSSFTLAVLESRRARLASGGSAGERDIEMGLEEVVELRRHYGGYEAVLRHGDKALYTGASITPTAAFQELVDAIHGESPAPVPSAGEPPFKLEPLPERFRPPPAPSEGRGAETGKWLTIPEGGIDAALRTGDLGHVVDLWTDEAAALRAALTAAEAERDKRIPWEDFQEVTRQHNLAVANAAKSQSQRDEAVTLAGEAMQGWHEWSSSYEIATRDELDARLAKLTKEGT